MTCSIVMPCWNEEQDLARTIGAARHAFPKSELIVVDAGSTDSTVAIARTVADRCIIGSRRQRAAQMNEGAIHATGEILLFLHADTILARGSSDSLQRAMARPSIIGGGFARRFDSQSLFLKVSCALAEARCRAFGWFLGDQAMFIRRSTFRALGGFRLLNRFEDLDLARRMKTTGRLATLRPPVVTSARRFDTEGPLLRTWRDFALTIRYLKSGESVNAL